MAATTQSLGRYFARPEPEPRERSLLEPQEGWLSLLLLAMMVLSTVWSIDQAHWVEGTGILFPLALAGLAAGYLLTRTRLSSWVGLPLGTVLGFAVCFAVVGQLLPPPSEVVGNFLGTIGGTLACVAHPRGLP